MSDLRTGDEVTIFFNSEVAPPYRAFGTFLSESDEYLRLRGTIGEYIGHELFIPKRGIKMIEVLKRKESK